MREFARAQSAEPTRKAIKKLSYVGEALGEMVMAEIAARGDHGLINAAGGYNAMCHWIYSDELSKAGGPPLHAEPIYFSADAVEQDAEQGDANNFRASSPEHSRCNGVG